MLTVALGFEHRVAVSSDAKQTWNGALRLLNILQFLPWVFIGCRDGIPLSPSIRPAEPVAVDAWADIERLVLSGMLPLIDRLKKHSVTAPEPLLEVVSADGTVVGTLELAWPAMKVGIVVDPDLAPLFAGWKILVHDGNDEAVADAIGELL